MLITPSNMDALFIGFTKQFNDCMMKTPIHADKIATKVPSGTRDLRYPFAAALSTAMREWTGPRQAQNINVEGIVVTNRKFESTVMLDRTDVEDDQYNVWAQFAIPALARNARKLADEQIVAAIAANATGYDGKAFFAADHYVDHSMLTGTQANLLTGKPLNATNLAIARATMRAYKAPDGAPLGVQPTVLMVPPSLEYVGLQLCNGAFYAESKNNVSGTFGSTDNVWRGSLELVVNEYLVDSGSTTTAVWYLLDTTSRGISPFLWQERMAPEFTSKVDPSLDSVFDLDVFTYGARARGAAALGLWFLACQVSGA